MKRVLALLAIATMGLVACNKQPAPTPAPTPTTATITAADVTVEVGKTVQVNATTNSTAPINFIVDDSGTYTVSDAGVVTGVKAGNGSILLKVAAVEGKFTEATKTINVTVTAAPGPDPGYSGPVEGTSEWSLIGSLLDKSWDTDWVAAKDGDIYVVKNVKLTTGDQFKFRKDKAWTENRGAEGDVEPFVLTTGEGQAVVNNGKNLSVAADGIYDIYYNAAKEQMAVCEPGKTPNWKDAPVAASITIDGTFDDWGALEAGTFSKSVSDPYAPWEGVEEIRCYAKDDMVFYYIKFDEESLADAFGMEPNDMHLRLCINTDGEYESGYTNYFLEGYDFIIEGTFADGGAFVDFDGEFHQRISGSWTSLLAPENGLVEGKGAGVEYEIALYRTVFNEAANTSSVPMPMGDSFQTGIRFYYNGWAEFSNVPNSDVDEEAGNGWGYLMRVKFN